MSMLNQNEHELEKYYINNNFTHNYLRRGILFVCFGFGIVYLWNGIVLGHLMLRYVSFVSCRIEMLLDARGNVALYEQNVSLTRQFL